ncbi:MAG: hypothetical protein JW814_06740 [Candidatus Krumholzibacteriota bacterium]|nr:hypothetical protein [Candidatus Krumholzibacteriota bacterium]
MKIPNLSPEQIDKIDVKLVEKLNNIMDIESATIEVIIEISDNLPEGSNENKSSPESLNTKLEDILNIDLPSDLEIINIYGFMNMIVANLPVNKIPLLFQLFNVSKIFDAEGDITPDVRD